MAHNVAVALAVGLFCINTSFAQELTGLQKRIFDRLDSNNDGEISAKEAPQRMKQSFPIVDSDNSKGISRAEFARAINRLNREPNPTEGDRPEPNPYQYYGSASDKLEIDRIEHHVLSDRQRNKDLQVRITFPAGKGPFPAIVLCHGLYGSKDHYLMLTEFWASHGYVVLQANHSDSTALGTRPGDRSATFDWKNRPKDVSFMFDSLDQINALEKIAGRIDTSRVAVGGHSFGAGTSQLIAGAQAWQLNRKVKLADDRIKAALLLSPQGPGGILKESSWQEVTKPLLVISGTKDGPTLKGEPAESRRKPYELAKAGDKYLVWVTGLDHGFGDITGAHRHRYNVDHINYVQSSTLAYWDWYLKSNTKAQEFLRSKKLEEESKGRVELQNK